MYPVIRRLENHYMRHIGAKGAIDSFGKFLTQAHAVNLKIFSPNFNTRP